MFVYDAEGCFGSQRHLDTLHTLHRQSNSYSKTNCWTDLWAFPQCDYRAHKDLRTGSWRAQTVGKYLAGNVQGPAVTVRVRLFFGLTPRWLICKGLMRASFANKKRRKKSPSGVVLFLVCFCWILCQCIWNGFETQSVTESQVLVECSACAFSGHFYAYLLLCLVRSQALTVHF